MGKCLLNSRIWLLSIAFICTSVYAQWSTETIMTNSAGLHSDIALDGQNYPCISHYDGLNKDLLLTCWNGSSWNTEIIDSSGDVGMYSSIGIHPSSSTYIAYYDVTNEDLKCAHLNGTNWVIEIVDSNGDVGSYCSLAMNWAHNPSISYYDNTYGSGQLKWARYLGSPGWHVEVVDDYGVGTYSSTDGTINNHFAYYDYAQNNLLYAEYTGSSWSYQTIEQNLIPSGTSIVEDNSGIAHACYFDATSKILCYSTSSTGWLEEQVDVSGTASWYVSIDLDSSGFPHIAYLNQVHGNLMYGYFNGSTWQIETVDEPGSVGYFCSLVLDTSNSPHIAYYDMTNSTLKYATRLPVNINSDYSLTNSIPLTASVVPNPITDVFSIRYTLSYASDVSIELVDLSGRLVMTSMEGFVEAGEHSLILDRSDFASGVYIVRVLGCSQISTARAVFLN